MFKNTKRRGGPVQILINYYNHNRQLGRHMGIHYSKYLSKKINSPAILIINNQKYNDTHNKKYFIVCKIEYLPIHKCSKSCDGGRVGEHGSHVLFSLTHLDRQIKNSENEFITFSI